jgi:hypothetical protein
LLPPPSNARFAAATTPEIELRFLFVANSKDCEEKESEVAEVAILKYLPTTTILI